MADPSSTVTTPQSDTPEYEYRQMAVEILSSDGTFTAVANFELRGDPSQPPRPLAIGKRATATPPNTTLSSTISQTHIILSTGSGHKAAETFFKDVVDPILKTIYTEGEYATFKIHTTTSATSIRDLISTALFPLANSGTQLRTILLSGDGGIIDLVNGFDAPGQEHQAQRSNDYVAPHVVVLPLGTANALYTSMTASPNSASKDNTWGLHALSSTTTSPLPTFTATFSPHSLTLSNEARTRSPLPLDANGNGVLRGAVVASWGLHAALVGDSDTAEYRKYGIDRFKMAAGANLYPGGKESGELPHTYLGKVKVLPEGKGEEGWREVGDGEHLYTLMSLVSNLEPKFTISPQSKPLEQTLHIVHFGPRSGDDAMRLMGLAYDGGKHVHEESVTYEAVDAVRIEFEETEERWRRICVDGVVVVPGADEKGKGAWVEIRVDKGREGGVRVVV